MKRHHNHSSARLLWATALVSTVVVACGDQLERTVSTPFDARSCLDHVPEQVKGLKILSGPRSDASIIRDMVPAVCGAQVLAERMKNDGIEIAEGSVAFRVLVEYTGEVNRVTVERTTLVSEELIERIRELILNTDFIYWREEDDVNTEFVYPVHFDR